MPRQPNRASSIYQGNDGQWHGRVSVGTREDGRVDRRHVRAKNRAEVTRKVRALERSRDDGNLADIGDQWTVASWLTHWVENIAAPFLKPSTVSAYRVDVYRHLIPGIGKHRLDKLRPEHVEVLYAWMLTQPTKRGTPLKPATVLHVHRTARAALNEAIRRGHLARNPVVFARTPAVPVFEIEPYSVDEVRQILRTAGTRRNGARWALALAIGLRQGEALGLRWADIDWERATLAIRRSRVRPRYRHGCVDGACGKRHGGHCPYRVLVVPETTDTKTDAGRRVVGLPNALLQILYEHRIAQGIERDRARQPWSDGDWMFARPDGHPVTAWSDWYDWKALLVAAGVRDGRVHDARHTAATVLLLLGVPERSIMGVMGWSHPAMTRRYAHMIDPIRRDIAARVDALIFADPDGDDGNTPRRELQ
jgi:integrase